MKNLYFPIFCVLLSYIGSSMAQELRVGTSLAPPYQTKTGANISGSVVDLIRCALDSKGTDYTLSVVPWKRATNSLVSRKLDIIFSFTENAELDKAAQFSTPLVLEKWYWYSESGADHKDKSVSVVVVLGSNQEGWLQTQGYVNIKSVSSIENAMKMLSTGRAKVLLTDQRLAAQSAKRMGKDIGSLKANFSRFSTLGAYISRDYLKANPVFLKSFNKSILDCKPVGITLDETTRAVLADVASNIQTWLRVSLVGDSVERANKKHLSITNQEIISLDKQWRAEAKTNARPLIEETLGNELSVYLKQVKKEHGGLYSEIFIMDQHGLNVGQSDVTSDYWQGDEGKFQKSFGANTKQPFVDAIEYDESSQSFQSQISLTIFDAGGETPIGAITVGVNVEKALDKQ